MDKWLASRIAKSKNDGSSLVEGEIYFNLTSIYYKKLVLSSPKLS